MSQTKSKIIKINETPFQQGRQSITDNALTFPANSRWTKQSFKDECDINVLMSRYLSTGELPNLNVVAPQYLDASNMDFQSMQNQVIEAQELFAQLPSKLRTRFANDPAQFLEYVGDPANHSEMRELGLLKANAGTAEPPISDAP